LPPASLVCCSPAAASWQAQLLVSQVSHHNIRVLRFSLFEQDTFLSAGRDSVRTYRLKGGSLRAISVKLEVRTRQLAGLGRDSLQLHESPRHWLTNSCRKLLLRTLQQQHLHSRGTQAAYCP
jgi:hypothetical protein